MTHLLVACDIEEEKNSNEPISESNTSSTAESNSTLEMESEEETEVSTSEHLDKMYDGDTEFSVLMERVTSVENSATNVTEVYGMTFDKETKKIKYLSDYIKSKDKLIEVVQEKRYTVIDGELKNYTAEELVHFFEENFSEKDCLEHFSSFYVDQIDLYIVVETQINDYSVVRFDKKGFNTSADILEAEIADEELSLMQKVLFNRMEYYGDGSRNDETPDRWRKTEELKYLYDDELHGYFYVQDLDKDGKNEVIVSYSDQVMIFHEKNGTIYGYKIPSRVMSSLYKDGTFLGTAGASENDLMGNISFDENQMYYDTITSTTMDLTRDEKMRFYKNAGWGEDGAVEITREEYMEIMSQYPMEMDITYSFTIENILEYVE